MERDKRLRSAVAAWVASADDEPGAEGGSDPADETAALPETAAEETALLPEVRERPSAERDSGSERETGEAGEADEAEEVEETGKAEETGGTGGTGKADESPEAGPADKKGASSVVPAQASGDRGEREDTDTDTDTDADADRPDEDSGGPAKAAAADKASGSDARSASGSDKPQVGDEQEKKAAEQDEPASDGPGDEAGNKPDPKSDAKAEPKPAPKADPESDSKPDSKPDAKSDPEPDAKAGADHPTTAFRAVTRPAPAGDSPTTALKIPPAPRAESNPAPKSAGSTAGERPSTFVPLRKDDEVRTASWGRKDGATAAEAPGKPAASGAAGPGTRAPEAPERAETASGPQAPASLTEAERTSQQPMPPQPPLDLLAQLTNTPDTRIRSAARRVKIWTPLVLLLLIVFAAAQVLRPLPEPRLTLTAEPSYTFEGGRLGLPFPGEGQGAVEVEGVGMVGTYGAQKPVPIASVTKTMTAYLILRDHPITGKQNGEKIAIDRRADEEYEKGEDSESVEPVEEGQEYTQREMLQMLMISSANNVARLLARWDAGSEKAFVRKMNDTAKELGMTDTVYTDPSGLSKATVSTPQDQLKLARVAMKSDVFREIVDTPHIEIPTLGKTIYNGNGRALLKEGIGGIKTGSSTPAGGNLLWAAQVPVDGKIHRILGVTLGVKDAPNLKAKTELAVTHSIRVIEAAQDAVTSAIVVKKGDVVGRVEDGLGGLTPVVATKDLKAIGWAGHKVEITLDSGGGSVPGSGTAGDEVGRVSVGTGPGRVSAPVALQRDMAEPGVTDKLTRVG
ncbi:serine hydrolase [Streptomyces sp. NPDC014894]|uniref:serine hydrolase n=1 Tax=Streptomyces sp. NPDC014894 TaxID=3364931 RepID=UPI0036F99998